MTYKIILFLSLVFLFTSIKGNTFHSKNKLYAGIATCNITPESSLIPNRKVHDSLYVKTIILKNKTTKIALIVVDNQGIPQYILEEAKNRISKNINIPIQAIMISSTHTHSGLIANSAPFNINKRNFTTYQKILIENIIKSVEKADKQLIPVQIGWNKINKPEYVFNRRWYLNNIQYSPYGTIDSVKTNPGYINRNKIIKPAGPTDPEITFFAIKKINNEPIAIFSNYSIHYIGSENNDISADYYGKASEYLSSILYNKKSTNKFIAIMSNGTSGDINNINVQAKIPHSISYEKVNEISLDIAKAIAKAYYNTKFYSELPIHFISTDIILKIRKNYQIINENKLDTNKQIYSDRIFRLNHLYPDTITIPIQTFQIGKLTFSAIPFEVFAETGLELKKRSPFKDYFTIGLANGHWGYLPTPTQFKKGGYETWLTVARVQENASEIIVDTILNHFKKLE